ncbi:hypothetical protein [Magnetovibrio sp.]|uniref:hypothetical protein n=1 Tax=Magnetovibrio sp. TaxID=2024836 RepID=UPI002F94E81E
MKYSDKYPAPNGDEPQLPPTRKFLGLHPLVWIFLAVLSIAVFAAVDHLEDADWDALSVFDTNHDDDSHDD